MRHHRRTTAPAQDVIPVAEELSSSAEDAVAYAGLQDVRVNSTFVAAAREVDSALEALADRFGFYNCVFTVFANNISMKSGENLVQCALRWLEEDDVPSVVVVPRPRLSADELVRFFQSHATTTDPLELKAVEIAVRPLVAAVMDVHSESAWFSVEIPSRLPSGALWDISFEDFAFVQGNTMTFLHLGYSD